MPRAESPPPHPPTAESPYFASALLVLKGAAVTALGIKNGGTTEAVKPLKGLQGRLTLNSMPSFPSKVQRTSLQKLVEQKVSEDVPFLAFQLPRAEADEFYKGAMFSSSAPSSASGNVRLVALPRWALDCQDVPVLRSTAQLGRLELTAFKHNSIKGHFDISFTVHPPPGVEVEGPALAPETAPLPLKELLPDGPEVRKCPAELPTLAPAALPSAPTSASASVAASPPCGDSAPAFLYPAAAAAAESPEALGRRLHDALGEEGCEAIIRETAIDGNLAACAARVQLSSAELAHIAAAPASADWLRETPALAAKEP